MTKQWGGGQEVWLDFSGMIAFPLCFVWTRVATPKFGESGGGGIGWRVARVEMQERSSSPN